MTTSLTQEFSTLSQLLGRDETRILRVLRAYHQAAGDELLQLDESVRDDDAIRAREVARRAAMACHLVGEAEAGRLLEIVASGRDSVVIGPVMIQQISRARSALADSISRIGLHIGPDEAGAPAVCADAPLAAPSAGAT